MKKIFKTFTLLFILSLICITCVDASNINMNLDNNITSNEVNALEENFNENSLSENETLNINVNNTVNDDIDTSSPRVASTTTTSQDDIFLTVENILSIIIIVIGILLVFLAIAILIRFK